MTLSAEEEEFLSDTSSLVFVGDFKTWKLLSQSFLLKKYRSRSGLKLFGITDPK